jgi:hypothetical protein
MRVTSKSGGERYSDRPVEYIVRLHASSALPAVQAAQRQARRLAWELAAKQQKLEEDEHDR